MVKAKEPVAEQWYPLNLGSTCQDDATTRFYSLRYEFKPASIDVSRPGTLHNSTENKVTVEFFNNQAGKSKVGFQGNSEECKELDAVLFFDGKSFRLERMHRAVKSLRHIRQPGESSAAAQGLNLKDNDPDEDANGNGVERISTSLVAEKSLKKPPVAPIQREKIESEEIIPAPTKPDPPAGKKKTNKKPPAEPKTKNKKSASPAAPASPPEKKREREPSPVNVDIDDEKEYESPAKKATPEEELEVEELVEELSEYEEVDISEDEEDKTGVDQTAASLRAQAAAGAEQVKASSSSSSSGSGSSGSGSGSSSSDSGSDEEDSASSADDGDDI